MNREDQVTFRRQALAQGGLRGCLLQAGDHLSGVAADFADIFHGKKSAVGSRQFTARRRSQATSSANCRLPTADCQLASPRIVRRRPVERRLRGAAVNVRDAAGRLGARRNLLSLRLPRVIAAGEGIGGEPTSKVARVYQVVQRSGRLLLVDRVLVDQLTQ